MAGLLHLRAWSQLLSLPNAKKVLTYGTVQMRASLDLRRA